ncbi:MAG: alpha/beta hydrolase family protein [Gammaproteobacteria bacterium]|nr:alpha/beta hydrolase family protein [Gammaproteobacteria bacterium]
MKLISIIISLIALSFSLNVHASDLAKEQRWADAIEATLMDGETLQLSDGKSEFLGIFTEASEDQRRAAIIMHGTGIHPDWEQVVRPLRTGLTEHNWHTLSIQMPVLPNDAEYPEYAPLYAEVAPRINAAIAYLKEEGYKKIVLIGHSQGSAMGSYYLSQNKADVLGFVGIGMPDLTADARMMPSESLKKITTPVLDLYASDDLKSVLDNSDKRMAAAEKAGNKRYSQVVVKKTGHFFEGKEADLIRWTADWIGRLDQ